jgi:hypothetical protein
VTSVTLSSAGAVNTAGVGVYAINAANAVGARLTNYAISYVAGNLTVNTKGLTITANNTNKVYGNTITFAGTEFSSVGLTNADSVTSVTLTSAGAVNAAGVGSYAVNASAATGVGLTNYAISYVAGNLTVNTKGLTITANNTNKVYGNIVTFTGGEFTSAGLTNADVVSNVTLTSAGAVNTAGVGSYAINASAATGVGLTNYAISYVAGTLTVNPKGLTITANNTNKVYGNTIVFAGTEFTSVGLTNADVVSNVTLTSAGAVNTAGVGSYAINASAATGVGLTNYTISYVAGNLTVNTKGLTITANNTNKVYGNTIVFSGTEFTSVGLTNADSVTSVTLSSAGAVNTAGVGVYAINAANAVGARLTNYAIS